MLFIFLLFSIGPLIFIVYMVMHNLDDLLDMTKKRTEVALLNNNVYLYQEHVKKQAQIINEQLDSIAAQLNPTRILAEDVFNHSIIVDGYNLQLTKEKEGYYWEKVNGDVSNIGVSANTAITPTIRSRLAESKILENTFKTIVEQDPNIAAIYFIGAESYWRIYPKLNVKQEVDQGYLKPDIDFTKQPFFYSATQSHNQKAAWTNTYLDLTHRKEVLSLSLPIHTTNGEFIGVIGADITLSQVLDYLLGFEFKEKGAYAVLIDSNQQFISYQPKAKNDLPFLDRHIRGQMSKQHKFSTTINKKEKLILTSEVENTGWQLAYIIPKKDVSRPINTILEEQLKAYRQSFVVQFISLVLVLTIVLIVISVISWRKFTKPLSEVIKGIRSINKNNLKIKIGKQSLTEFQVLSEAFNQMADRINELVENYQDLNSKLEGKVQERTAQLKRINLSLKEANDKLSKMEEARKTMFANIAHDLKTPITLVLGYMEAIQHGVIQKEDFDEYLNRIQKHLHSINHLVKEVYELNNVEMGQSTFKFEEINVEVFFQHLKDSYKNQENIDIMIESSLPSLHIDKRYMERAIFNLIDNALKYSEPNASVMIRVSKEEKHLHIVISDSGWGISPEDLPYIFDRFYRVDKARNSDKPGNGLGLAIVREIIHAHRGEIKTDSQLGKGTKFTIMIPFRPV
ncbi:sensor histidine kinase [Priestia abyssalis]|uniref:sensor histidine kinase n=1 Tax=Priestia abyssalis TaxID=1221450 RepID=UPI00147364FA|nr:sensor histidine kinase [Priestia abyssalis]